MNRQTSFLIGLIKSKYKYRNLNDNTDKVVITQHDTYTLILSCSQGLQKQQLTTKAVKIKLEMKQSYNINMTRTAI